jgi:hypothetical protein
MTANGVGDRVGCKNYSIRLPTTCLPARIESTQPDIFEITLSLYNNTAYIVTLIESGYFNQTTINCTNPYSKRVPSKRTQAISTPYINPNPNPNPYSHPKYPPGKPYILYPRPPI